MRTMQQRQQMQAEEITEKQVEDAKYNKFALSFMTFYFVMYVDILRDDDDELNRPAVDFCVSSLVGATYKEAFNCVGHMLTQAHLDARNGELAFDYGCPKEMIWSELFDYALAMDSDRMMNERIELISLLPLSDEEQRQNLQSDSTKIRLFCDDNRDILMDYMSFDCPSFLQWFYPHAWDDELEVIKNGNLHKMMAELDFVMDHEYDKRLSDEYCDVTEINTDHVVVKPTKGSKEKKPVQLCASKYLYLMKCGHTGHYKIGVSQNPKHREATLQSEKPTVNLVAQWADSSSLEKYWHKHFASNRLRGEWFDLNKHQVAFICSEMKKKAMNTTPTPITAGSQTKRSVCTSKDGREKA